MFYRLLYYFSLLHVRVLPVLLSQGREQPKPSSGVAFWHDRDCTPGTSTVHSRLRHGTPPKLVTVTQQLAQHGQRGRCVVHVHKHVDHAEDIENGGRVTW